MVRLFDEIEMEPLSKFLRMYFKEHLDDLWDESPTVPATIIRKGENLNARQPRAK
jgi:hypothetical protein